MEKVDYCYHIKEEAESGVMYTLTVPCADYTVAFPADPKQVHRSVIGDQIGEESGTTLINVLWQAILKALEGSISQLVRELELKFSQHRRCYASADVVLINIGVAPDLVASGQGRSKCPQSNDSTNPTHGDRFAMFGEPFSRWRC